MFNTTLIILMAGKATRLEPISYTMPKGLNIIGGKPAIFNNIDKMIERGLKEVIVVCNANNLSIIEEFFNKVYKHILSLKFVVQKDISGPLSAFKEAEPYISQPTLLLLGDTICDSDFNLDKSFVGYVNYKGDYFSRWCYLETAKSGIIKGFVDKPKTKPKTDKVVIGIYYFKNHTLLKQLLTQNYDKLHNEFQLSSLMLEYMKKEDMYSQLIKNWKDIGSLEGYVKTNTSFLSGRYFNDFSSDGFTIKKSSKNPIIKYEIEWYKKINKTPLKVLTPSFISYKSENDLYEYEMEVLSGNTLYIYDTFYNIAPSSWSFILEELFKSASYMWNYKQCSQLTKNEKDITRYSKYVFIDKTYRRVKEWDNDIIESNKIIFNQTELDGFNVIMKKLEPKFDSLIKNAVNYYGVIHGDLNFTNIFYYPEISKFKFIDPRGKFYKIGILGDKRYDVAKIRHSYIYKHNKLVQNYFTLNQIDEKTFEAVYDYKKDEEVLFNQLIKKYGFHANEIKLIDALLFISQIPLHQENKRLQKISLLIGLKLLNECLND